jgi:hypothetical protein
MLRSNHNKPGSLFLPSDERQFSVRIGFSALGANDKVGQLADGILQPLNAVIERVQLIGRT